MRSFRIGQVLLVASFITACGGEDTTTGAGGAGASSSSGGAGGATDTSSTTDTSSGGAGGMSTTTETSSGGAGGGTSSTTATTTTSSTTVEACEPGTYEEGCYTGPPGTLGVGTCAAGYRECLPNGVYGPCMGDTLPQPEICETAADEDCDGANAPCTGPGSAEWVRVWGGPDAGTTISVYGVRADAQGNVHVGGGSSPGAAMIDFGGGFTWPTGAYLARFDAGGATTAVSAWQLASGAPFDPGPADRIAVSNHAVGLLQFDGELLADEVGFDGAPIAHWDFGFASDNGGSPDVCSAFMYESSVSADPHELTVSALYRGDVTLGGQILTKGGFSHDIVVARLQEPAAPVFVHPISAQEAGEISHARLPDGDIAALAYGSGPFVDAGVTLAPGGKGYLLARFDGATGALEWSKWLPQGGFGGIPCRVTLQHVVALPDGSIVVWFRAPGGVTIDGATYTGVFGLARFDGDGDAIWVAPFPNAINQTPDLYDGRIVATDDGGIVWAGNLNAILDYGGTLAGQWSFDHAPKPVVVKVTASTGAVEWAQMLDPVSGRVDGVAPLPGGSVALAGTFKGSLLIAGTFVDAPSEEAGWVAKLQP